MLCENDKAFGEAYNIAVGENFTVNFLYEEIRNLLNVPHEPTYREPRSGDIRDSLADITKAKTLLGYNPTQRFIDGLKKTVEHFKALHANV
jgi:UDP-N-acetylglucosamine 4-epimerase